MSASLTLIENKPLTDMQGRWALGVANGLGPTVAAAVAGYANPSVAGARMGNDPRIRAVVKALRNRRLDKLASLSLRELEVILKDRKVSAAVRMKAITLSLGLAGHSVGAIEAGEDADARKRFSEMTVEDLDAFIAKEKARREGSAMPVVDAELVEAAVIVADAAASEDSER